MASVVWLRDSRAFRLGDLARPGSSQRHPGLGLSPALPRLPLAGTLRAPPSARQALPEPPSKSTWPFAFQPSPDHCSILLPAQKPSWPLVHPTCFFSNHARFPSERRSLRLLPRPPPYSARFECNNRPSAPSGSSGVLFVRASSYFFSQRPFRAGLISGRRPIIGAAPTYAVPRLRPDRLFTNSVTTDRILRR